MTSGVQLAGVGGAEDLPNFFQKLEKRALILEKIPWLCAIWVKFLI